MRVAVVGANGQLGRDVVAAFAAAGHDVLELTHADIEVVEPDSIDHAIAPYHPDLVVNTAAMHNVDRCEADPLAAFQVNVLGASNLAQASERIGFRLIHISTDYVFDGRQTVPYAESDLPGPLNMYGLTKLGGEHALLATAPRALVVRTGGLFGASPCRAKGGLNFVELMLKLGRERGMVRVVTDEVVSPTYTADLARQLQAIASTEHQGLFHATSQGSCSWYEFACAIFGMMGLDVKVTPALVGEFPGKIRRPPYSVLANDRLSALGLDVMPRWEVGLRSYLTDRRP